MAGTRRLPNTQAHGPIALAASSYFAKVLGLPAGLEAWPCKTVLLVPFLSLCRDVRPLITGNLVAVEQSLRADHAASKVQIIELTTDPGRDTPAPIAAYARLTDASWQLVTEPPAELHRLAKFFGFYYQASSISSPASTSSKRPSPTGRRSISVRSRACSLSRSSTPTTWTRRSPSRAPRSLCWS